MPVSVSVHVDRIDNHSGEGIEQLSDQLAEQTVYKIQTQIERRRAARGW